MIGVGWDGVGEYCGRLDMVSGKFKASSFPPPFIAFTCATSPSGISSRSKPAILGMGVLAGRCRPTPEPTSGLGGDSPRGTGGCPRVCADEEADGGENADTSGREGGGGRPGLDIGTEGKYGRPGIVSSSEIGGCVGGFGYFGVWFIS